MKIYRAVIWTADGAPGQRVSIAAESLDDAHARLEQEYGAGTVFLLQNEEDASKPRQPVPPASAAASGATTLVDQLTAAVAASAPLRIREIVYSDPTLSLVGADWSLSLTCPWQLRHGDAVLTAWDRDDVEDVAWDLIGGSIESVAYAPSGNPKDPAFQISGGLSLEVAADTDLDPWVMTVPGGTFVGGLT